MFDTMSVAAVATGLGAVCTVAAAFLQKRLLHEKANASMKLESVDRSESNQSPEFPAQLKPVRHGKTDEMSLGVTDDIPVTTIIVDDGTGIVDDGTGTHYSVSSVSIDNPDKKPADVILKEITDSLQKNAAAK